MFKNYLKLALRNLNKNKGYTVINIAGFGIALAVCLTIGLFVGDKLSYDHHFNHADRHYRIIQTDSRGSIATTPPGLANALENQFAEIEYATIITSPGRRLFIKDGERLFIEDVLAADDHFFEVFPFHFLQGDQRTALAQPNRMVITNSLAQRLFGKENPVGKIIRCDNKADYEIKAVIEDVPPNTHFHFKAILSLPAPRQKLRDGETVQWNFFGDYLYVSLNKGTDPGLLENKMTEWARQARTPDSSDWQLTLQPVTSIHLHSRVSSEIMPQSDIRYIYLFSALAFLVLAIACINYMNLATAHYAHRAKEVGIRKIVGASRVQLARQFITESVLVCLLALPLAIVLVEVALPLIQRRFGLEITLTLWRQPGLLLAFASLVLIVGFGSGSYPAFLLSQLKPVQLPGGHQPGFRSAGLFRKILVVVQFTASLVLLVSTLVIYSQMNYVRNKRLGFEKDHVVMFSSNQWGNHYEAFKQELLTNPNVLAVTSGPPMGIGQVNMSMRIKRKNSAKAEQLYLMRIDYGYIETLGLNLVQGRRFSKAFSTDPAEAFILNESAASLLDISDNPLGQFVSIHTGEKKVVGIVKNFHNKSLHSAVQPMIFELNPGCNYTVLVRLRPTGVAAGLAFLKTTWAGFVPDWPFEFRFLSDRIERQYRSEQSMAAIFIIFSALAIFIACLGLFGLTSFIAERRTKEIGIRKILGASVTQIIGLLTQDFTKWVLSANVIAWPIAYYAMNKWLQNFAYRIDIGWWTFLLAGALALVIALLTVSYQAVRAATANPVESLRYE